MLKLLLKDLVRSPARLLAVCLVIYLATMSFFVAVFLAVIAGRYIRNALIQKAHAVHAAAAEAARAEVSVATPPAPAKAVPIEEPAVAALTRQYAKSAVVIPFRTGTGN